MNRKLGILPAALLAGLLVLIAGSCSDSDGNLLGSGTGQMTVSIHDQAAPSLSEVWVTFSGIEVRNAAGEWVDLGIDLTDEIDIMTLTGPGLAEVIASAPIDPGTYDAVRITISAVRVVLSDDTEVPMPAPPGGWVLIVETGFDVNLAEDGARAIVLHFDVDASFQIGGTGITFDPSITMSN